MKNENTPGASEPIKTGYYPEGWISIDDYGHPSAGKILFATWDSKRKEFYNHMVLCPRTQHISTSFTHYFNLPEQP